MQPDTETETPHLRGPGKQYQIHIGGLPGALIGVAIGAVGLVVALVFGLVLLAALLSAGVVFGGYLWWKTRKVRRLLREQQLRAQAPREREVEGEVIHMESRPATSADRLHEAGNSSFQRDTHR